MVQERKIGFSCAPWTRYLVLVMLFFSGFGGMVEYDAPGSLQNALMDNFSLSEFQFSLFYSLYSWPTVVMCFIGGFLVDKVFGVKLALIINEATASIGVALFVAGLFLNIFWLMLLGRFIFGIGGEMSGVCCSIFALMWFKGKELNTVFAILQNMKLGTAAVYLVSNPILQDLEKHMPPKEALNFTFLIISGLTPLLLLCAIILALMNQKRPEESCNESEQTEEQVIDKIKISDIKNFPITFWILCILYSLYSHATYTFLSFSQEFFTTELHLSVESSNLMSSLFNIIPIFLSVFLGFVVDKVGRNLTFMVSAVIVGTLAHTLAATLCSAYLIIVLFAISTSLMTSASFSTVAYSVEKPQYGTAYGIYQSISNLMLSCGSLISGWIISEFGFITVEVYYIVILIISLSGYLLLWTLDKKRKNVLNMNCTQRLKYEASL